MEERVLIRVSSHSRYDGGEDRLQMQGSGLLRRSANGWTLDYQAAGEDGQSLSSRIRLSGQPPQAILWNRGAEGYTLTLRPGHDTRLSLPSGLALTVRTTALSFAPPEPDGCIRCAYTLLAGEQRFNELLLEIHIHRIQGEAP